MVFGLEILRDFKGLLYPVSILIKLNRERSSSRELVGVCGGFSSGGWTGRSKVDGLDGGFGWLVVWEWYKICGMRYIVLLISQKNYEHLFELRFGVYGG